VVLLQLTTTTTTKNDDEEEEEEEEDDDDDDDVNDDVNAVGNQERKNPSLLCQDYIPNISPYHVTWVRTLISIMAVT